MSPESSAKSKKPQENAGKEILTALSQQEVALWLDALWASLPADSREIALNRMPRDTRETLQQLLRESQDPKVKTKTKTVSLAKREQIWSDLWGEWEKSYYQQAAEGLERAEQVKALALQLTAYEHRFNWSVMLAAFRQEELSQSTSRKLWQSWRDDIIRRLERNCWGEESRAESSWWLPWLLDSVSESPHHQGSEKFPSRIKQWLADVPKKEKPSKQDFLALRLLTNDLGEIRQEKWHQYPNFLAVVLKPASLKTPDSESRQSFLQQLAPQDLWKSLMAYWQSHLDSWIPQPETAYKSDYSEQAKWVAAWRELSPTAEQNLLAQWRVQHKKRRNLWKALADMGLS